MSPAYLTPASIHYMQNLVHEGKVKYLGISEATPAEIKKCARLIM